MLYSIYDNFFWYSLLLSFIFGMRFGPYLIPKIKYTLSCIIYITFYSSILFTLIYNIYYFQKIEYDIVTIYYDLF